VTEEAEDFNIQLTTRRQDLEALESEYKDKEKAHNDRKGECNEAFTRHDRLNRAYEAAKGKLQPAYEEALANLLRETEDKLKADHFRDVREKHEGW
jgi:hypothetical protein